LDLGSADCHRGEIVISDSLGNFPDTLKMYRHFVLYQKNIEHGEVKKRPFDWLGGHRGNDSPELQLDFGDALKKLGARTDLGIAIYQPEGGTCVPYAGGNAYLHILDCDGFIAKVNGKPTMLEQGWNIVDNCSGSYSEETVSGTGFKIFVLSDLEPQTKRTFKLNPNSFAELYPAVKKYGSSHAVESFSKGFWNAITGQVIHKDYAQLKFIPKEQLLRVFAYLKSLGPEKASDGVSDISEIVARREFLNKYGLITALSKINNQSEAIWNDIAYSLARIIGAPGIDLFIGFSRGDYNGKPYDKYCEDEVRKRYARALLEVQKKPAGYGLSHLSRLSGLPISAITLEIGSVAVSVPGVTAAELATQEFPPLEWVVDGILPEGSYLLSARPKVGKSWLGLQICLGVAYGERVLGRDVKRGKAIYLALEDNHRRLQSRLRQLRPTGYATEDLILHTKWARFHEGGVEALIKVIKEHQPRIIVIDTLAKVRPPGGRNSGIYEADYGALAPITEVANKYRTTILIIHHNRKGKAETDPLEQISGSLGLAGAVDGALVIDGNRGDPSYTLSLIGRDIPNDDDLAITLQKNGQWVVLGAAREVFISRERQALKELLLLHPEGLKPRDVVDLTGKKSGSVRKLMNAMARDGQLVNIKGTYSLPKLESNSDEGSARGSNGNSGNTSASDAIDSDLEVTELPVLHG
jgi:hypothetical protein